MLENEMEDVLRALGAIEGVAAVTRGWPKADAAFPCLVASEVSNTPAWYCDDGVAVNELVYEVRVFDRLAGRGDAVASAVDGVMLGLGYSRVTVYDDNGADVRARVMRYKVYR